MHAEEEYSGTRWRDVCGLGICDVNMTVESMGERGIAQEQDAPWEIRMAAAEERAAQSRGQGGGGSLASECCHCCMSRQRAEDFIVSELTVRW